MYLTLTKILLVVLELRWYFWRRWRLILNRNKISLKFWNLIFFIFEKKNPFFQLKGIHLIVLVGFILLILGLHQGQLNLSLFVTKIFYAGGGAGNPLVFFFGLRLFLIFKPLHMPLGPNVRQKSGLYFLQIFAHFQIFLNVQVGKGLRLTRNTLFIFFYF